MNLPAGPSSTLAMTWNWLRRPLEFLDECAGRYGDVFTIRFANLPPLVVFSNPDHVKEVFTDDGSDFHAGKFNQSLRAFLGDHSILMLDGKEHLRHRRLLLPPFHGERMQAYGQAMLDITDAAIEKWHEGEPFALHGPMQSITLEVILRTVLPQPSAEEREHAADHRAVVAEWLARVGVARRECAGSIEQA